MSDTEPVLGVAEQLLLAGDPGCPEPVQVVLAGLCGDTVAAVLGENPNLCPEAERVLMAREWKQAG